jgi:hypothetical protein
VRVLVCSRGQVLVAATDLKVTDGLLRLLVLLLLILSQDPFRPLSAMGSHPVSGIPTII